MLSLSQVKQDLLQLAYITLHLERVGVRLIALGELVNYQAKTVRSQTYLRTSLGFILCLTCVNCLYPTVDSLQELRLSEVKLFFLIVQDVWVEGASNTVNEAVVTQSCGH